MQKDLLMKEVGRLMFKGYVAWSICADIILVSGIVYLIFF